jgi:hypothetical protein
MKVGTRIKNPDLKAKIKEKSNAKTRFAFLVRWQQFDRVDIDRYQVLKVTKTKITYLNEIGSEFTLERIGYSYRWFLKSKNAKAFARNKLKERIELHTGVIERIQSQIKSLKAKK